MVGEDGREGGAEGERERVRVVTAVRERLGARPFLPTVLLPRAA